MKPACGGLLDRVSLFLNRFVVLRTRHQVVAITLWIAHTHAIGSAYATPYLLVISPQRRSGKSRVLEVVELVVARPWRVAGTSEAALFRKIEQDSPTLLLDEIDAIFGSASERTEPLRAILNAGNRRGAHVARCVGSGGSQRVVDFGVFGAKALAGIDTGRLPDTVTDRSIIIRLARKLSRETVERFRYRTVATEAEQLSAEIEAWVAAHAETLEQAEPEIPEELNDRAAEAWEPLFAIADVAGGDWPTLARSAALALSVTEDAGDDSLAVQLLADIRQVWTPGTDAMSSEAISALLTSLDDAPWKTYGNRRAVPGLTQRDIARTLRPFEIKPRTVRVKAGWATETKKGYRREQLAEAWERYLPAAGHEETADGA